MLDIKDAFLAQDALAVVIALVGPPLMRHAERQMTDKDLLMVQLVITFLRNLIVIPDSSGSSGVADCSFTGCNSLMWFTSGPTDMSTNARNRCIGSSGSHRSAMRGKLLSRLFEDSALELLLVMAQHTAQVGCPSPILYFLIVAFCHTASSMGSLCLHGAGCATS